jgi:hypothetical protein
MLRDLPSLTEPDIVSLLANRFGNSVATFSFDTATIPRLDQSDRRYIYLHGDSNVDDERGVTIVIRDAAVAGCVDAEELDDILDWDANEEIDELLAESG